MTITEESTTRLPYFGMSRGQVLFRYAHQELARENEAGESETCWACKQQRFDKKDVPLRAREFFQVLGFPVGGL